MLEDYSAACVFSPRASSGKTMMNVLPVDSDRASLIVPLCASATERAIARPNPAPAPAESALPERARRLSTRKKRSKMRGWASAGIPIPVSEMEIRYVPSLCSSFATTRPPGGVYSIALFKRFSIIRRSKSSSPVYGDSANVGISTSICFDVASSDVSFR